MAAGRAQPAQQQRAHASHALAGLSAWALASDEQGRQPGTGTALAEDLQALYRCKHAKLFCVIEHSCCVC